MKRLLVVLVLVASACTKKNDAHPPSLDATTEADPPTTYMGRPIATPMSYLGADWLDRTDREATEQPEHVLDVLAINGGMTVADVGAGSGYFTARISKRVGPKGRVIATDLQDEMLAMITKKNLANVVTVRSTPKDAKLPKREIDLVLMVDVYHELPYPAETMAQIREALKPGGRVALVEYRAEDPEVPIKPEHKMTLVQIKSELAAAQFAFVTSDESLPQQRIVVFTPQGSSPR